MKKISALFLSICLVLCFSACTPADTSATTPPVTTDALSNTETTCAATTGETSYTDPSVVYDAPMTSVSVPIVTQHAYADGDDDTTLFTYTHQDLSVVLQDADVADAIIVDFLNRMDNHNATAQAVHTAAQSAYTGQDEWVPYFYSVLYDPMRIDQSILSMYGTETLFNESPRSSAANISLTYDLSTGAALQLSDILESNYSAEKLVSLITDALKEHADDGTLFADYAYIISDMFSTNVPVESWYFSQKGLCFFFNPYEIAPFSAGTIVAQIPYDQLGGIMKDQYFPAEQVHFVGNAVISKFAQTDTTQFAQFTEVVLDADGEKYLLYAEGTLLNVRLEVGDWSDDNAQFVPTATVFAAAALTTGDALMIQVDGDDLDDLRLTYEVEGTLISHPIDLPEN